MQETTIKGHTLEFLRTIPHLRGRTNTFNAVWRVRSVLAAAIHEYFQTHNYVYVNTPLITGSDCEGAGEMFQVTTIGYSKDYKNEGEADEVDLIWISPDTYEDGQTTPFKFTYDNEDLARIGDGDYLMVLCEDDDDESSKVFLSFPITIKGTSITVDLSKLVIY